jgi:hypothetical protein
MVIVVIIQIILMKLMKKALFIFILIYTFRSLAQTKPDTLVLNNKYSKGTVELIVSDSGLINKFKFIDLKSKFPISGIVVIYGKKSVSYHISEYGISKQSISKINTKNWISFELTKDKKYYSETHENNNLKGVYTVVKTEDDINFYNYTIKKKYILLKHSFSQNGKLQTKKSKVVEIPSSHRLPMDQFTLKKHF